jgi:hypothetical protein
MVAAHLILPGEQTMSSTKAEPKSSYYELNEEELEKATGGSKSDYFLQIDGIKGESQDSNFRNEIHM